MNLSLNWPWEVIASIVLYCARCYQYDENDKEVCACSCQGSFQTVVQPSGGQFTLKGVIWPAESDLGGHTESTIMRKSVIMIATASLISY